MTSSTEAEIRDRRERLKRWIPDGSLDGPTHGINHIAVFVKDMEETARFYTEVMGFPVVGVTSNRDVPESTHMNVHVGNGICLSLFDFPHIPRLQRRAPEGVGNIMHVALPVTRDAYAAIKGRLDASGTGYQEVGGSIYVHDPNGLGIELLPEDQVVTPEEMAAEARG